MEKEYLKKTLKILVCILIIGIIIYFYILEDQKSNIIVNPRLSKQEQLELEIEELKEENYKLEDELSDVSSQLEELQRDYAYAEDLIDILQDQLEEYGIEPYEL